MNIEKSQSSESNSSWNNQLFLVFDSLRWDVFKRAKTPFLKSLGKWRKAHTQATYTFPAMMSFFAGKLPQTREKRDYYDTVATRIKPGGDREKRNHQFWRLENPESFCPARYQLSGRNIVEGFASKGYHTIGTGGVNWFNPKLAPGQYLTGLFQEFKFFNEPSVHPHESGPWQLDWALERVRNLGSPWFLFINFGETHHRFVYHGCDWHDEPDPYGDHFECKRRQQACLEYLDKLLESHVGELKNYDIVACADHGEAMGENGLWGHGFYHKRVMEVPLLIKSNA